MEPLSLIATATGIARLATEHGPGLLRSVGKLLGGKAGDTADTIATLTEQVGNAAGLSEGERTSRLRDAITDLPPEHQLELARIQYQAENEALRIETERELARLRDRQAEHEQTQTTIRQGDVAEDTYIRRTRPGMARGSCWGALAYVFAFELLGAFGKGGGASWELAAFLASPALTYLGLRTLDGFAPYSKSSRDKRRAP
jgi:hypothetical protein